MVNMHGTILELLYLDPLVVRNLLAVLKIIGSGLYNNIIMCQTCINLIGANSLIFTLQVVWSMLGVNLQSCIALTVLIALMLLCMLVSHSQQTHMIKPVLARRSIISDFRYVVSQSVIC